MFLVESTCYFCIFIITIIFKNIGVFIIIWVFFVNYVIANWMTDNPNPVDRFNITIMLRSKLAVVRVDPDPT